MPFTIAVAMIGVIIWRILEWRYRAVIDKLERGQSDKNAVKRAPTLTSLQRSRIVSKARECECENKYLDVLFVSGSRAAHELGGAIAESFKTAGWRVSTGSTAPFFIHSETGVAIGFGTHGKLEPYQTAVKEALDAAGIVFDMLPPEKVGPSPVAIYVNDPD